MKKNCKSELPSGDAIIIETYYHDSTDSDNTVPDGSVLVG